jgi:hypothetical protein
MELFLRRENVYRGAREAVKAVMPIYVKREPVSSSIIAIIISNSSLSSIASFYLAPRTIDANFVCPFGGWLGTAIFGSHIRSEQYSALSTWRDSARAAQYVEILINSR